jgi:hypothetical protein
MQGTFRLVVRVALSGIFTVVRSAFDSRIKTGAILALVGVLVIIGSALTREWWTGLLQNLGTGLLTSLLLIGLYDRITERRDEADNHARRRIAVRRLAFMLRIHVEGVLFDIYYGGAHRAPGRALSHLEFVQDIFAETAARVNVLAPTSSNYPLLVPMGCRMAQTFTSFKSGLDAWLAAYVTCVTNETVSAVEILLETNFFRLASYADRLVQQLTRIPNMQDSIAVGDEKSLQDYACQLSQLITIVEGELGGSLGSIQVEMWAREYFPIGHARLSGARVVV